MSGSALTATRRTRELDELAGGEMVDVLVVGGGVTGTGVALDAITRGLSVALVERRSLAHGTSRWSSKLAHGGLRYLASGQLGIAWESARERHHLITTIAPHLVRALPFLTLMPERRVSRDPVLIELGVRLGDALRRLAGTSRRRLPATRRIGVEEARRWAPALSPAGIGGALLHWDGQLEDDARLVIALARTAAGHGARILTHAEVVELRGDGARVRDEITGATLEVRARHVVNATGVWAGGLVDGLALRPSRGAHLLVGADRLGSPRAALNVGVPGHFGRFVFAVPREDGLVLIGLTDDAQPGPIPDVPAVSAADEEFLLATASAALERPLSPADVVGRYAGLRPLLDAGEGATSDVSRRHAVIEDGAGGVVTVVGGKLTTYRRMAQDTVDRIAARPGVSAGPCATERLALIGSDSVLRGGGGATAGLPARLVRRFGTEAAEIAALATGQAGLLEPVAPEVPVLGVELLAAVEREGALTEGDVLDVHTRAGLVPAWREACAAALERLEILPADVRVPA